MWLRSGLIRLLRVIRVIRVIVVQVIFLCVGSDRGAPVDPGDVVDIRFDPCAPCVPSGS